MIRVDCTQNYLGNYFEEAKLRHDVDLARSTHRLIEVSLTQADRQKSRIYVKASSGEAIGLLKRRDWQLTDGDTFELADNRFLSIHLSAQTLMTLSFDSCLAVDSVKLVHLGHTLGDRHYPITVAANKIYIQIDDNAGVLESALESFNITGLKIGYETRSPSQALIFGRHQH